MIKSDKLLNLLNEIAPFELSCDWDNCGILVDSGRDIERILVCLDATPQVVLEAVQRDVQLIISHHPIIFKPLSSLDYRNPVYLLCKHDISCIAMHTNLDAAEGGVNDLLCDILEMQECSPFEDIGRMGRVRVKKGTVDIVKEINKKLNYNPKYYDAGSDIKIVAVVGGAGSMVQQAYDAGVDCLVTGELRHSDWLLADRLGVSLIEAGHYATEHPVITALCDRVNAELKGEAVAFVSDVETEPAILFR